MDSCWKNFPNRGGFPLPFVGSWTHFNKQVSCVDSQKALIKYMPVILQSVNDYSVSKS